MFLAVLLLVLEQIAFAGVAGGDYQEDPRSFWLRPIVIGLRVEHYGFFEVVVQPAPEDVRLTY